MVDLMCKDLTFCHCFLLRVGRGPDQPDFWDKGFRSNLQQRDQEVDGQHDVLHNLVLGHGDVTNGNGQTQDLLQLELDGGSDFVGLLGEVVGVRNGGREFTGCKRHVVRGISPSALLRHLPLERPGPNRRGICLIKASEAKKASYFLASFLTSFLFLLSLRGM